jgi:glycosyltransferase involved in cell wall biosynthesis
MKASKKKGIAVWQPYFRGGGAEAVALWILEALKQDYDVTLFTLVDVDFSLLNSMYNTQLDLDSVTINSQIPRYLDKFIFRIMDMNKIFRMAFVYWTIKHFKDNSQHYDLTLSAFNAVDLGRPSIQYIHWVNVVEKKSKKAKSWLKILMKWVDFSYENLEKNKSLVNSKCTAGHVKKCYGIDSEVVYPPVIATVETLPWSEREDVFLCSGRIVKSKQTHRVIKILKKVREKGIDVKLFITGGGSGNYGSSYFKEVKQLAEQNSEWVKIYENLTYSDYLKVASQCRYGIHLKPEPFGISVAEMVKADIIPFVRSQGGQIEIVGTENSELLFQDESEAIEKIIQVVKSPTLQKKLLESLNERKELFSTEKFTNDIRLAVSQYFESM